MRTPDNVLNLAMFRRLAVVLASAWCGRQRNARLATTNGFIDSMSTNHARRALSLALCSRRVARSNLEP